MTILRYYKNLNFEDIYLSVNQFITDCNISLPSHKNAKILLKPNFNSNMNALTGNTTDLRLLSATIKFLKDQGYLNIIIGEGTNSGFHRNNINVMERLKVDELAKYYGILLKDFNFSKGYDIELSNKLKVSVARDCFESDLFINMPKMKTHFEVGMSVCLKNLIGCLVGQENKKKMHQNLTENIIFLNQSVQPDLHVVDALIAMEGLGPTQGDPIRMDLIIFSNDPYATDLFCARLASFDCASVSTLKLAQEKGLISYDYHFIHEQEITSLKRSFRPPQSGILTKLVHNPKRQKYFLYLRNTKFFSYLASTKWFGRILYLTGLRQDQFLTEELEVFELYVDLDKCTRCLTCLNCCPLYINISEQKQITNEDQCLFCLYCYSVCPNKAIYFKGKLGFFQEQEKQYDSLIRKLYQA